MAHVLPCREELFLGFGLQIPNIAEVDSDPFISPPSQFDHCSLFLCAAVPCIRFFILPCHFHFIAFFQFVTLIATRIAKER